jgi:hypothetical protein
VNVDNSDKAFIDLLNIESIRQRMHNILKFQPCRKKTAIKIKDRITYTTTLMTNGLLRINRIRCENLWRELQISKWIQPTHEDPKKRDQTCDHSINALEYALENYYDLEYKQLRKNAIINNK